MDMTSTKFEEIMSKHNMHEKDEFKSIKSLNIFYQVCTEFHAISLDKPECNRVGLLATGGLFEGGQPGVLLHRAAVQDRRD